MFDLELSCLYMNTNFNFNFKISDDPEKVNFWAFFTFWQILMYHSFDDVLINVYVVTEPSV